MGFAAVFYAVQWRHQEEITARRPEVPPALETLVHRLLEKEPVHRYQDAVALSHQLDSARLLTFDAEGHTAFGRSACAIQAVTTYLADLTLPPPNTVCSDEIPPTAVPTTPSSQQEYSELRNGVREGHDLIRVPN